MRFGEGKPSLDQSVTTSIEGGKIEGGKELEKTIHSTVTLNMFRHDEKDGDKLTPAGRQHVIEEAMKRFGADNPHSVAFGSPQKRSQETALLAMSGKNLDTELVTNYTSVAELEQAVNEETGIEQRGYGSKLGIRDNLNFKFEGPIMDQIKQAMKDKRYFEWLATEADTSIKPGDEKNWNLNRQAGNIAAEILKYVQVGKNFDKLVEQKPEVGDKLDRFLGSHSGVLESFLARVVEKTHGQAEREKFVKVIPDAFDYFEGFTAEIITKNAGEEPTVHIKYEKKGPDNKVIYKIDEDVPLATIQEIMDEAK